VNEQTQHGTSVEVRSSAEPRDDGLVDLSVDVTVVANWHLFAPGSSDGLAVRLTATPASQTQVVACSIPDDATGHLSGTFRISATVQPGPSAWEVELRTQACSGSTCRTPERFRIGAVR
jgi:hypothetical protein